MSKEVKIGLVLLIAIVGGIWGLNFLKGINLFRPQTSYYSIYENTGGLTVSSSVVYQGNKVGRVQAIELYMDSLQSDITSAKWKVFFTIDNSDLKIPSNTIARIWSNGLLGSKAIQLQLGSSKVLAKEGSMLIPEIQQDIAETVTQELEPLKQSIEKLVGSVEVALGSVNSIFEDDATQGLPKVFESLQRSMNTLEVTFTRVDGMIAENRQTIGSVMQNVNDITGSFKENTGALDTILTNFSSISDSLAQIEFVNIIQKVNRTTAELAEITEKINNGDGTLSQILNSDSLVVEIERTNHELQYLLNDIYTNPKKYLGFSVVGRKDRNGFSNKEEDRIREIIGEEK